MPRSLITLALVTVLLLGACGDDDSSTAAPTTTSPGALGGDDPDPTGEGDGVEVGDEAACQDLASAAAAGQAADSFPDNPHNRWAVADTSTDEAGRAVVEVVPTPDDVGYPRFRFVSRCDGDEVVFLGAFALDGGSWVLLFTTNEPGAADLVSGS
jgi:hypothetical protein